MSKEKNKNKNRNKKKEAKPSKWLKFISKKAITIYAIITILGTISGFFDSIISPIYDCFFPKKYIRSEMDNKIRGEFLSATSNVNKDSIEFVVGSSINREIGFRWFANDLYNSSKETYRCFHPNEFIILFDNSCPIMYRFGDDGRILFSGNIAGNNPDIVLALSDNEFILDDSKLFTWNGDDYGLELIDSNNKVLFSVDFVPPSQIWIQGIFHDETKYVGLINKTLMPIQFTDKEKFNIAKDSLKRIFKYTGGNWQSRRADNYLKK